MKITYNNTQNAIFSTREGVEVRIGNGSVLVPEALVTAIEGQMSDPEELKRALAYTPARLGEAVRFLMAAQYMELTGEQSVEVG